MPRSDLHDLVDRVEDEKSFIAFVSALATDRGDEVEQEASSSSSPYDPGVNGWENGAIEAFLEAAVAWAEASINGKDTYKKRENSWQRCAEILLMGKLCE